jgi:hypothetical protein
MSADEAAPLALSEVSRRALASARRWAIFLSVSCVGFVLFVIGVYGFSLIPTVVGCLAVPPGFLLSRYARAIDAYLQGEEVRLASAFQAHRRLWIYLAVASGAILMAVVMLFATALVRRSFR